jgi:hypothetical protein
VASPIGRYFIVQSTHDNVLQPAHHQGPDRSPFFDENEQKEKEAAAKAHGTPIILLFITQFLIY